MLRWSQIGLFLLLLFALGSTPTLHHDRLDGFEADEHIKHGADVYVRGAFYLMTAKTPSSSTDTGITGQICWDSSYIYACVATDTWKRATITGWGVVPEYLLLETGDKILLETSDKLKLESSV